jgi:hypothetical protein
MKKILQILLIFSAGIIITLLIIPDQKREIIYPTNKLEGPKQNVFYDTYMNGCVNASDGSDKFVKYCQCTYDYMVESYGEEGFYRLSLDYVKTEKMPQEFLDAVEECLFHLETNKTN